ncbi:MAG: hypothetical protein QM778_27760 [Myxococcales bacterium]
MKATDLLHVLALAVCLALVNSLAACTKEQPELPASQPAPVPPPVEPAPTPAPAEPAPQAAPSAAPAGDAAAKPCDSTDPACEVGNEYEAAAAAAKSAVEKKMAPLKKVP